MPLVKNIKSILTQQNLLTVSSDDTALRAAKIMSSYKIGCLLVLDSAKNFSGIISERDILGKVTINDIPAHAVEVQDIMTSEVITVTVEDEMSHVENLMSKHKIRHVPIVQDGQPIGLISSRDIINYHLETSKLMQIAAEQFGHLMSQLKSFKLDDVIDFAINKIPESFEASHAILVLHKPNSKELVIHRNGCDTESSRLASANQIYEIAHEGNCDQTKCISNCCQCPLPCHKESKLLIPLEIQSLTHTASKNDSKDTSKNTSKTIGYLCMCGFNAKSQTNDQVRQYKASLVRDALNKDLSNANIYKQYSKVKKASEVDHLTGLGSRRSLEKTLKTEYSRAKRYNRDLSVAILDIDKFKQVNDQHGHDVGDAVLKQVAELISHSLRSTDVIATRFGGDEFVLLLPETSQDGAMILLERLRKEVEQLEIAGIDTITISCGVSNWHRCTDKTAAEILKRADEALYKAKANGRNCVAAAKPPQTTTIES